MKVLILCTSDYKGGAARATYRLHQGLRSIDVCSQMMVQEKQSDDKTVIGSSFESGIGKTKTGLRLILERLPLKLYANRSNTPYSPQWLPNNLTSKIKEFTPDIINLHWIGEGYLRIESIARFNQPIIWTLHDSWAFTGGCHIPFDCNRYLSSCGSCPQLGSQKNWDMSRWIWQRKLKAWKNLNLTIVTPSHWLAQCARSSSLFKDLRVEVIPHGLNTTIYSPREKSMARTMLNLPQDKQIIVFGAIDSLSDRNKGFHLLQLALQNLSQSGWQDNLEIAVFGASESKEPTDLGFKVHYLGKFADCLALSLVYSAADVMIVPSLQESFGQTAFEAMACGTPVVAFNATGLKDIVDHQQNGYLAQPYETEDLARGIAWVLENKERHQKLSYHAREKTENEFTLEIQAHRYLSLYTEILEQSNFAD
jgi:glycosyltransferase involved in cell wall biosynthesis